MGPDETLAHLVDTEHGVILVRRPTATPSSGVIIIHAPGENRCGNNYFLSHTAARMAEAGIATITFNLSGFGDSLGEQDVEIWSDQIESARQYFVEAFPECLLHWLARGAGAAMLPAEGGAGHRIAISPPTVKEIQALASHAVAGTVTGEHPCSTETAALWAAIGAESNLVGGWELSEDLLGALADRLETCRWDHEVAPKGRACRVRSKILLPADDLLVRLQTTRMGLTQTLIEFIRSWS